VAAVRLAGHKTDGRGSQAVALRASAIGGCRACTGCMSAMGEELRHLAGLLPEAELRPQAEASSMPPWRPSPGALGLTGIATLDHRHFTVSRPRACPERTGTAVMAQAAPADMADTGMQIRLLFAPELS
jgi:hypothetical protein